jgi:ABC-type phosphate/phosphonate transport system substrate-binding protein
MRPKVNKILVYIVFIATTLLFSNSIVMADHHLEKYHFGIPPYQKGQTVDEIRSLYKPMLVWLGEQVGCLFDVVGSNTYKGVLEMLAEDKIHLGCLGSVPYVSVKMKNPDLRLLLTELRWNHKKSKLVDYYNCYIVAQC